jgi:hypothetical protein
MTLWFLVFVGVVVLVGLTLRPYESEQKIANALFLQMSRWSTAATQDANPIIAVLHANYGVGYMMSLQTIAADEKLERWLGVMDLRSLFREVERIQHEATRRLVQSCPGVAPTSMLAQYGAEAPRILHHK